MFFLLVSHSPSILIFFSFLFFPPPSFLSLSSPSHFLLPFSFFLSFKKSFMLYFPFLLFSSPLLFSLVSLSLYLCFPFFFSIIYHSTNALCLPDTVVGTHYERGWVLDLPYVFPRVLGETKRWAHRHSMLWPVLWLQVPLSGQLTQSWIISEGYSEEVSRPD